jgi:hypothetical protein
LGFFLGHAPSLAAISALSFEYSPIKGPGQLQYPKSGMTHLSWSSSALRVSTQCGCMCSESSGQSPRLMVNSVLGMAAELATTARCIECRMARARG